MTPELHSARSPLDGCSRHRTTSSIRGVVARRIRILRATRGWSQETFAELSGLHRSYISGIERAKRNVSLDNIEKIAHAFEIPLRQFTFAG